MRPRIQVKCVTEHMNYIEENIHFIRPVVGALQVAVEKSKTWLEHKNDNKSLTYCDLCQELESATLALLDVAAHILNENIDNVDTKEERSFSSQSTQKTATEKRVQSQSTDENRKELHEQSDVLSRLEQIETAISSLQDTSRLEQIETAISSLQDTSRLEQIETAISSLQDTRRLELIETAISSLQDTSRLEQIETAISSLQDTSRLALIETAMYSLKVANIKSTDDISEIQQWRDNFVTEQSDMGVNIEQITKKQKQMFKSFRQQINEQDNKVKELNKEIESLEEKETKSNKTLEKLSLDMKEYENNLHKLNKEIQDHTDKTDSITQEIKRHYDLIVYLQDDNNKIMVDTSTKLQEVQLKHNVMYKLLQQRLMPVDKLIQIFNQNLETKEERIKKLDNIENTLSKLSKDFDLIESRVSKRYVCYLEINQSRSFSTGSIISTFDVVREINGQHLNQTTGKFVSPHDGLYLVCVTLDEWRDKMIVVGVRTGDRWCTTIRFRSANASAAGSAVVDMKEGEDLYFEVIGADQDAVLSGFSSFTIVSL